MSKITIPLALVLAAIAILAWAKLDSDRKTARSEKSPSQSETPNSPNPQDPPVPIDLQPAFGNAEFARLTDRAAANIRLIDPAPDAFPISFLWPTNAKDEPSHPELLEFAQRPSFERWKSYIDDDIGFYYPDFPGVRVEVVGATTEIPLIAPAMVPQSPGTSKRYRVTAGETGTLFVIALASTDSFDDTQRAPYPEIFHRYTPSGRGLLRTAFTETGQVRRVELLGGGKRATLLDWPHLAVHQDLYLRIALGIKLAGHQPDWQQLSDSVIAKYNLEGRLGLLSQGMTESEITSLVGQPVARDPINGTLQYFRNDGPESIFYTLTMNQGMFAGFRQGWRQVERPAPVEGSVRWMYEKTDYHAGPAGGVGYNLGPLTDLDAEAIMNRVIELGPTAGPDDWRLLCDTITNLAQHGIRSEQFVDIARARLESPSADPNPSLLALQSCDSDLAKAAIAEHITTQFEKASLPEQTLEHFYTLIAYLGEKHPATAQLIYRALGHPFSSVRELGFQYCSWLPAQFALPHFEAGLLDSSTEIRQHCANAFATSLGDSQRHPKVLAIALSQETDEQVRILLRKAIQRLGPAQAP